MEIAKLFRDLFKHGFEKYGKFYSKYRGFVYDREDPLHLGRLKLTVPEVAGRSVIDVWAYPVNTYSGVGYGSQNIPEFNDMVWVEFEKGDARKPLWSFGHKGDKDTTKDELKNYDNKYFQTPGGHLLELDDTNGIIRVTSSSTIELLKAGESLQPAVLGDATQAKIEKLIDLLLKAKTNTSFGPQPLFNILIELQTLKDGLNEIKSANIKIGA